MLKQSQHVRRARQKRLGSRHGKEVSVVQGWGEKLWSGSWTEEGDSNSCVRYMREDRVCWDIHVYHGGH